MTCEPFPFPLCAYTIRSGNNIFNGIPVAARGRAAGQSRVMRSELPPGGEHPPHEHDDYDGHDGHGDDDDEETRSRRIWTRPRRRRGQGRLGNGAPSNGRPRHRQL